MNILETAMAAWREITRRLACARAVRELEALSDRQLDDLGIPRDQIAAYVTGEVCRNGGPAVRPAAWVAATRRTAETAPVAQPVGRMLGAPGRRRTGAA